MGVDIRGSHEAPPPRRASRPRRDGGEDPVPQVQHRPVGPRPALRGGRGARSEARGRRRGQGLRHRGRGRAHPGREPRGEELRVGTRPFEPGLPRRLERLRDRRPADLFRGARDPHRLVRSLRLARLCRGAGIGMERGDPRRARSHEGRQSRQGPHGSLGEDSEGAGLREVRQRVARNPPQARQPRVLGHPQAIHGEVRRRLPGGRPAGAVRSGCPPGPDGSQLPCRHERSPSGRGTGPLPLGSAGGDRP